MIQLKHYILEKLNIEDEQIIQDYVEIISLNPKLYKKYIELLKNEYDVDYWDYDNDDQYIKNASLKDIKTKKDFINFDNYIKYARKIYSLRNISLPSQINKILKYSDVKSVSEVLGFKLKHKEYNGIGNIATFDLIDTITIPNEIDVNTLIHEIGHFFDRNIMHEYVGLAKTITHASSPYRIDVDAEVFAENFMHFFIKPNFLKKKLPNVYKELNKNISKKIKNIIFKFMY